jgi:hypothetical protein
MPENVNENYDWLLSMYISRNEYVPACVFLIFHSLNMLIHMLLHIFVAAWNIRVSHMIFFWKEFDFFFFRRKKYAHPVIYLFCCCQQISLYYSSFQIKFSYSKQPSTGHILKQCLFDHFLELNVWGKALAIQHHLVPWLEKE